MEEERHKLLVIIVTYKSSKYINKCIADILNQDIDSDILIVDNNSKDDIQNIVSSLGLNNVKMILNADNFGYAAAVNQGLLVAMTSNYEYVFVMNPDVEIADIDVLSLLIKSFQQNPMAGAIGPYVVQSSWGDQGPNISDEVESVDWISGCGMLLRLDVVRDIGFFDEQYFLYFEESDYLRRLMRKGYKVIINNSAIITHLGGASTNYVPTKCYYYMIRNIFLFVKKNTWHVDRKFALTEIAWHLRNKFYWPMHPFRIIAYVLGVISGLYIMLARYDTPCKRVTL